MSVINKNRGPKAVPDETDYNPKQMSPSINYRDINTLIYHQGVRVRVYKTLFCPNIKSIDGGEHEFNCPICKGSGFIDVDPIDTYSYVQGQSRENLIDPEKIGTQWEEQTVLASFISGVELSYYTKVELTDYTNVYKQVVQRQPSTNIDRLHFKAHSIDYVIDEAGTVYSLNTDYQVDRNGDIEWITGGRKPADKKMYSIHYNTIVSYRAIRAIHSNRYLSEEYKKDHIEAVEAPQQWVLKKLYLFRKEDSESGQKLDPNKIFPKG